MRLRTQLLEASETWGDMRDTTSRDLRLERLLFGVTYRATDRATVNWGEGGVTEDAPDPGVALRMPLGLLDGG